MESSSSAQNGPNIKIMLSGAETCAEDLKTHLSDGTVASKEVVTCCMELLKFSCSVDESEEFKTAAVHFLLEKNIPGLIYEIYGALLAKYPDVTNYDREKVEGSEENIDSETLQQAQDVLNLLAGFTVNLTDVPQLATECGNVGLIPIFLEMSDALKDSIPDMIPFEDPETKVISKFTSRGRTLSRLLGALVNLAKQVSNRAFFKDSKGVEHLLPFLKSKVTAYYLKALFCLAYLIEESNNELIMADVEHIKFVIQMLEKASKSSSRAYLGFSTSDIADGISQLAVNENNSKQLGLNGGIPVIVDMLKTSHQVEERLAGTKGLWMLSFDVTNRVLIKAIPTAIETLQSLRLYPNKDIVKASCGVLWEIERNRDSTISVVTAKTQHIMVSYQWDSQATVLQVKDKLTDAGFTVWIDVENMTGSTLESMASAVENCTVFLMAVSRKYLESPNCRSEAEYAYQLRKQIIPLMMEPRFQPHSWLGIIMGTKLWIDFREARNIETGTSHLIRELGMRAKSQATGGDQNKSKEDNLKTTLLSYKKKHRSVYVYLSESEKLIRSLRSLLVSGQLATEGAFWKADALVAVYTKIPDQPSRTLVVNFLIDVNIPELLTEIVRTLRGSYPEAFYPGKQENSVTRDEKEETKKKKASVKTENENPAEASSEAKWALEVMLSISIAILNFTDLHDAFCEACGSAGLVKECLELLEELKKSTPEFNDNQVLPKGAEDKDIKFSTKGSLTFELLGVLHNLSKRTDNKKYFDSSNAVETLLSFFGTQFPVYRMTSLLCLAYLVDEKNNHLIMASEEPIKDILNLLEKASNSADRRSLGFSAAEIAYGLSHVATNDGNKKMIGQLGGIPLLVPMLKSPEDHEEERIAAVKALYMLSFDETNKEMIKGDDDTMTLLQNLQSSSNKELQQAASGVIWEIEGKTEHARSSDSEEHVMISYQWDTQETMLRVKTELESQGFSVWMDVEQMEGSILETMARAVEKSSVFLLAVSQKYQNSPNCRSEAEYAYQRRKRMIPLMMEPGYSPDGWLGIILGSKLWMDFRNEPTVGIKQLTKEISKGKAVTVQTQSVLASAPPKTIINEKVLQWQREDVAKWLHDIGFEVGNNEVRGKLDGPLLYMLNELRKESPEFFYNSIKTDLGLPTVIEVLQFTKELKELLS